MPTKLIFALAVRCPDGLCPADKIGTIPVEAAWSGWENEQILTGMPQGLRSGKSGKACSSGAAHCSELSVNYRITVTPKVRPSGSTWNRRFSSVSSAWNYLKMLHFFLLLLLGTHTITCTHRTFVFLNFIRQLQALRSFYNTPVIHSLSFLLFRFFPSFYWPNSAFSCDLIHFFSALISETPKTSAKPSVTVWKFCSDPTQESYIRCYWSLIK